MRRILHKLFLKGLPNITQKIKPTIDIYLSSDFSLVALKLLAQFCLYIETENNKEIECNEDPLKLMMLKKGNKINNNASWRVGFVLKNIQNMHTKSSKAPRNKKMLLSF